MTKSGLMFHHIDTRLNSKPFMTLITCNSIEDDASQNAVDYFKLYAKFMDAPNYGIMVRNGGRITGHGKSPEKENQYPKILEVYKALEKVGEEIVVNGKVKKQTLRTINNEILPVPFIRTLKRIPAVKRKMIQKARMNSQMNQSL